MTDSAGRLAGLGAAVLSLFCRAAAPSQRLPFLAGQPRLGPAELTLGVHHTRHAEVFGEWAEGYGRTVLQGVDAVQSRSPEGGGYYVGRSLRPRESPVDYELRLFGFPLLAPPRSSSYCSGATYAAFVEALNFLYPDGSARLGPGRLEELRMQEPDGATRLDYVKVWGNWNSQWGHELALVSLTGMGEQAPPERARPGDFVNIAWKAGKGHAAVFLGWAERDGAPHMLFWSSQKHTRGYGDRLVPLSKIKAARFVRLTHPERVFTFEVESRQ